ncbi:D-serine deaminase-like pyridoxal phosphate-dependent protein [Leifsonia sp. AK011]|uniref:amino acid deaminase/aldolase n=1 Tax=Leifsonia sp. AK011 TaxID=2723075 RepID=UPI0015CC5A3A|nr:amino acid deaminase/aldolase [Leifsonia sp. AK011]NYF10090.1 D-serine deaminase-like pyridoxal phosphate-dependent protein [Leifsonia sp. AK011]
MNLDRPTTQPWLQPASYWGGMTAATASLDTPVGALNLTALAHNTHDMLDRANGTTIRVASKSLRVRGVIERVLTVPGYAGVLAYTLPEALWLAETIDDVVVGYPSVDATAIRTLGSSASLARRVTIMVDSVAQLDAVDAVLPPGTRENIRVCLELDASWKSRLIGHTGVYRSPVHSVDQAVYLARHIVSRRGFDLVGIMSYEAQIAGVTNRPPGKPVRARLVDWMQRSSFEELTTRRGEVVTAVREIADLEFVNGGGTGSLERTSSDPAVTEIAAGSGLFGPRLFDGYSHFTPAPAAAFALSVVRKPTPELATLLGGGWIASGPPAPDRMPQLAWPERLEFLAREGAGEVQSPVRGAAAARLAVGDRVWLRHTKAGEASEHLNEFAVVNGDTIVDTVPTYRGEGKAFL